jgi:hypothetical protein
MKVVKVRSPFIVEVNQAGQVGSKVTISIWNGSAFPTSGVGFYSLSKSVPGASQINNSYNVSNYVKEFIDNIKPTKIASSPTASFEDNNEWIRFKIERFWYNGTAYTSLGAVEYVGVNGFTTYTQGVNAIQDYFTTGVLTNKAISKNLLSSVSANKSYINYIVDFLSAYRLEIIYVKLDLSFSLTVNITGLSGVKNVKIPMTTNNVNFALGNRLDVNLYDASTAQIASDSVYVYVNDECKYTPVECTFINRYGGWEFLTFFKAQTNSVSVKGTDYKLTQSAINYNTAIGQFKTFNINGKQTVKLNTGWVDENYSELITDLLLSETVLLDGKPVTIKTQSSDFKTNLKDKNINYEIEFEYAFNLINEVI